MATDWFSPASPPGAASPPSGPLVPYHAAHPPVITPLTDASPLSPSPLTALSALLWPAPPSPNRTCSRRLPPPGSGTRLRAARPAAAARRSHCGLGARGEIDRIDVLEQPGEPPDAPVALGQASARSASAVRSAVRSSGEGSGVTSISIAAKTKALHGSDDVRGVRRLRLITVLACLIAGLATAPAASPAKASRSWAQPEIKVVVARGLMARSVASFRPERPAHAGRAQRPRRGLTQETPRPVADPRPGDDGPARRPSRAGARI